ncbi:MAG: hypothetical protein AMXMBFR74_26520 [Parvibaculum sp.]
MMRYASPSGMAGGTSALVSSSAERSDMVRYFKPISRAEARGWLACLRPYSIFLFVTPGLDPGVQSAGSCDPLCHSEPCEARRRLRRLLDCRVKPGNDICFWTRD